MWNLVFNMILLRIISFSVDKVWASQYYETHQYHLILFIDMIK